MWESKDKKWANAVLFPLDELRKTVFVVKWSIPSMNFPPTFTKKWQVSRLCTPFVKLIPRGKNKSSKVKTVRSIWETNTSISVAITVFFFIPHSLTDSLSSLYVCLAVFLFPACRVTLRGHSLLVPPYPPSLTGSVSLRCGRLTSTWWPTPGTRTAEPSSERMSSPSMTRQSGEGRKPSNYGWGGSRGWIEAGLD